MQVLKYIKSVIDNPTTNSLAFFVTQIRVWEMVAYKFAKSPTVDIQQFAPMEVIIFVILISYSRGTYC